MNKYEISKRRSPVWGKLAAVMEALDTYPNAEWIWWLDMDAIIMTRSIDLYTHLLDPETLKHRLVTGDTVSNNVRVKEPDNVNFVTGEVISSLVLVNSQNNDPSEIDVILVQDFNGLN